MTLLQLNTYDILSFDLYIWIYAFYRQMENGMYMRMALLKALLTK